jgi:ABC-type transporter Mla subunit MlaD
MSIGDLMVRVSDNNESVLFGLKRIQVNMRQLESLACKAQIDDLFQKISFVITKDIEKDIDKALAVSSELVENLQRNLDVLENNLAPFLRAFEEEEDNMDINKLISDAHERLIVLLTSPVVIMSEEEDNG